MGPSTSPAAAEGAAEGAAENGAAERVGNPSFLSCWKKTYDEGLKRWVGKENAKQKWGRKKTRNFTKRKKMQARKRGGKGRGRRKEGRTSSPPNPQEVVQMGSGSAHRVGAGHENVFGEDEGQEPVRYHVPEVWRFIVEIPKERNRMVHSLVKHR